MAKDIKLEDFNGFKIDINFDEIAKKNADELAKKINQNIQQKGWTGSYANSWGVVERKYSKDTSYIVRSEVYQLSHLLENGHFIVNAKNRVGKAAPRPHIMPAYRIQRDQFLREVENIDVKLEEK